MTAEKQTILEKHMALLNERYDLANQPAAGATMSRGKAIQQGIRVELKAATTWDGLATATEPEILDQGLCPEGFLPLYFDGEPVIATKKGVNILERGSQVHFMAEFQALLDFPRALARRTCVGS
jgi:hypothetical protein